jgi:prefoldin subunit 5
MSTVKGEIAQSQLEGLINKLQAQLNHYRDCINGLEGTVQKLENLEGQNEPIKEHKEPNGFIENLQMKLEEMSELCDRLSNANQRLRELVG